MKALRQCITENRQYLADEKAWQATKTKGKAKCERARRQEEAEAERRRREHERTLRGHERRLRDEAEQKWTRAEKEVNKLKEEMRALSEKKEKSPQREVIKPSVYWGQGRGGSWSGGAGSRGGDGGWGYSPKRDWHHSSSAWSSQAKCSSKRMRTDQSRWEETGIHQNNDIRQDEKEKETRDRPTETASECSLEKWLDLTEWVRNRTLQGQSVWVNQYTGEVAPAEPTDHERQQKQKEYADLHALMQIRSRMGAEHGPADVRASEIRKRYNWNAEDLEKWMAYYKSRAIRRQAAK